MQRLLDASLQRMLSVALLLVVAVLVFTGVTAAAAAVWTSLRIVDHAETILALEVANRDVRQDMNDAESGVQAVLLSGRRDALQSYEMAMTWLPSDQQRLTVLAQGHDHLLEAVDVQERAVSRWLEQHVTPLVARIEGGQTVTPDNVDVRRGHRLFKEFRAANDAVEEEIAVVTDEIRSQTRRSLAIGLAVGIFVPLLAIAAVTMVARRLSDSVAEPLMGLTAVLDRLRAGDSAARAEVAGPLEVRQIAGALNTLADENLRGRDIEADVLTRLAELDRVRNDLVTTVSHELRTPLTSIKGYLEILQDDLYDRIEPHHRGMFGAIRRNLDRLTELISNLLALSKAESPDLNLERLDLRGVIAEVASDVRVTAAGRDISVRTVLPAAPLVLVGDRSQLVRAVSNLASNAVKFSRPGGVVELRVEEEGREAVVRVVDEGIGIPAGDLSGLGSRFYRASNAVKAEIAGTGLGLRIVQTILDHHDGGLLVESVEGEGTVATVRLPLRRDLPTTDAPAVPAGDP